MFECPTFKSESKVFWKGIPKYNCSYSHYACLLNFETYLRKFTLFNL